MTIFVCMLHSMCMIQLDTMHVMRGSRRRVPMNAATSHEPFPKHHTLYMKRISALSHLPLR